LLWHTYPKIWGMRPPSLVDIPMSELVYKIETTTEAAESQTDETQNLNRIRESI